MKKFLKLFLLLSLLAFIGLGANGGCGGCGGDTVKPHVIITEPDDNSTVSGVVSIKANATDNVGVVKVEFYVDDNEIGEDTSSPYVCNWDTSDLRYNSTHTIQANAYDIAGNVGESPIITVRIGNLEGITWQKTFGGFSWDGARSIQQTTDGGYIVAGGTASGVIGQYAAYILKLSSNGDLVWQKTFGENYNDFAYSIQQTVDGGYIVAGDTVSPFTTGWDVCVLKLDPNGNLLWQKTFGGNEEDGARSIQQTTDGGYIVAGRSSSFDTEEGVAYYDAYILKLNSNGDLVWQKTFGGSIYWYNDCIYSIQQTTDGGYIAAGGTESFGAGSGDVYILKLDPNGNLLWQKTFGGSNGDGAYSIQQTTDGGYIVAGGTASFGAGSGDVYILKLDPNGNLLWQKTFGGSNGDGARSIQQTTDGGYIVAGDTASRFTTGWDVCVLKLDLNGNLLWQKTFGGFNDDSAYSIQQTVDGGCIVAGDTYSFGAGSSDAYILKLDASGNTGPYPTLSRSQNSSSINSPLKK